MEGFDPEHVADLNLDKKYRLVHPLPIRGDHKRYPSTTRVVAAYPTADGWKTVLNGIIPLLAGLNGALQSTRTIMPRSAESASLFKQGGRSKNTREILISRGNTKQNALLHRFNLDFGLDRP
jgi:hypothetical protein